MTEYVGYPACCEGDKWDPRRDEGGRHAHDPKFGTESVPLDYVAFVVFMVVLWVLMLPSVVR